MAHITAEEVLKLAKTANITITEEELPRMLKRLEAFIGYASYLQEVAAQYEGSPLPKLSNITREDKVTQVPVEPFLELAPEREENYFVVPVILKQ
jgi:aspartyl/glutamyl-tRNA(Asn/Gln) amidotransferase C subunit